MIVDIEVIGMDASPTAPFAPRPETIEGEEEMHGILDDGPDVEGAPLGPDDDKYCMNAYCN